MYLLSETKFSPDFINAWNAAGTHLTRKGDGATRFIRTELAPPMIEHHSFIVGNQLFFVYLNAAEYADTTDHKAFLKTCDDANAVACFLPMKATPDGWVPTQPGWGLVDTNGGPVDPVDRISSEQIPMSLWEAHALAVSAIKDHLEQSGLEITSTQPNPHITPSIHFTDPDEPGSTAALIVTTSTYPPREQDPLQKAQFETLKSQVDSLLAMNAVVSRPDEEGNASRPLRGWEAEVHIGEMVEL
jgi:hypothetical protein